MAASAVDPCTGVPARLDEAGGSLLAGPVGTVQDDPPADSAPEDGYAVCGEGPWLLERDLRRPVARGGDRASRPVSRCPGTPTRSSRSTRPPRPSGPTGESRLLQRDPLTGLPDERVRPDFGEGIVRQGTVSRAGHALVAAGAPVTAAVLALAAAAGLDEIPVVRPPVVGRARPRRPPARSGPAPAWPRAGCPRPRGADFRRRPRGARQPGRPGARTPSRPAAARDRRRRRRRPHHHRLDRPGA